MVLIKFLYFLKILVLSPIPTESFLDSYLPDCLFSLTLGLFPCVLVHSSSHILSSSASEFFLFFIILVFFGNLHLFSNFIPEFTGLPF